MAIAANNAFVYFADRMGAVQRRGVGGGQSATILSDISGCGDIVAADDRVFLSCTGLDSAKFLLACDLDGSNAATLLDEESPFFSDGFSLVFVDGRIAWWVFEDDGNHLRDIAEEGSGPRTRYSTPVSITNQRLAVDSDAYFFAEDATIQMLAR